MERKNKINGGLRMEDEGVQGLQTFQMKTVFFLQPPQKLQLVRFQVSFEYRLSI